MYLITGQVLIVEIYVFNKREEKQLKKKSDDEQKIFTKKGNGSILKSVAKGGLGCLGLGLFRKC